MLAPFPVNMVPYQANGTPETWEVILSTKTKVSKLFITLRILTDILIGLR